MATNRSQSLADPVQTVFEALSNSRRQRILSYLAERSDSASLDGLAGHLATETGADPAEIRISLVHSDLPKLEEMEMLTYDHETETVRRCMLAEQAITALETTRTVLAVDSTAE